MSTTPVTQDPEVLLASLNEKQRAAVLSEVPNGRPYAITANGNTLRALERKGLCTGIIAYRDGTVADLTPLGCAVFTLMTAV